MDTLNRCTHTLYIQINYMEENGSNKARANQIELWYPM